VTPAAEVLKPEAATQQPEIKPTPGIPAQDSDLAKILADDSLGGEGGASFTSLFAYWGSNISMGPSTWVAGLEAHTDLNASSRRADGPGCADWISRYSGNLTPRWQRRYAALVGLGNEKAKLAIGGQEYTYPLSRLRKYGTVLLYFSGSFHSSFAS